MQNLAHYVQCHPSFRYLRVRHKRSVVVVFLIFLVFFIGREFYHDDNSTSNNKTQNTYKRTQHDDELVILRSQVGYLKKKLAKYTDSIPDANDQSVPIIYVITPTYKRPVQRAELTRLCHSFLLVPNLHWIVVEDSVGKTEAVSQLLSNCGVTFTHLTEATPPDEKLTGNDKHWSKPRGVVQRNAGIHHLRDTLRDAPAYLRNEDGVVYFADDDNTYSVELFEEMRHTKTVSVWPVGLVGGLMVEKPKVHNNKVTGWDVTWAADRPFAVDMAGFAVNLELLLQKPKAKFAYRVKRGFQESEFLRHLVTMQELEPQAIDKVLVWHTRSEKVNLKQEDRRKQYQHLPSDDGIQV